MLNVEKCTIVQLPGGLFQLGSRNGKDRETEMENKKSKVKEKRMKEEDGY